VIDAAARVFYERGYSNASVQDVADELGILKGSLYHYIDTKEDLLFRLLDEVHEDVQGIIGEVAARDELDALGRIALYVRRTVEYNVGHRLKISVYYHDVERLTKGRRDEIFSRRQEHESFLTGLIAEAQGAGQADPALDARIVMNCIFGTVTWVYRWYRPGGTSTSVDLPELCAQFVLSGITGPAKRAGPV
jgi:AcrR family transcriptional regulator